MRRDTLRLVGRTTFCASIELLVTILSYTFQRSSFCTDDHRRNTLALTAPKVGRAFFRALARERRRTFK